MFKLPYFSLFPLFLIFMLDILSSLPLFLLLHLWNFLHWMSPSEVLFSFLAQKKNYNAFLVFVTFNYLFFSHLSTYSNFLKCFGLEISSPLKPFFFDFLFYVCFSSFYVYHFHTFSPLDFFDIVCILIFYYMFFLWLSA